MAGDQLPYLGANEASPLAMTIVMPDDLEAFESHLTPSAIRRVDAAIRREKTRLADVDDSDDCGTYPYAVRLFMPKFGIDTKGDLVPSLKAAGMQVPFTRGRRLRRDQRRRPQVYRRP